MWLLNAKSITLKQIPDEKQLIGKYAILSHTWAEEEVTFQDMRSGSKAMSSKKGYLKIRYACRQAVADHIKYVWVDTCCIDKSSSGELSEAINSMWRWYYNAQVCYTYIADIPRRKASASSPMSFDDIEAARQLLAGSRWVTRSWTLQELIAPTRVDFYIESWQHIGAKSSMVDLLSGVTGISVDVMQDRDTLSSVSVAQRMSWAAKRESTREEDRAYSLLGIFNVNMAMLYGEGSKAFTRLQEEIVKTSLDHSLFAWEAWDDVADGVLFSPSPYGFRNASTIESWTVPERDESFDLTNKGLKITLPAQRRGNELRAVINCRYGHQFMRPISLRLEILPARSILPAKVASNTVCHLKPTFDIDKGSKSHVTTLDANELHTTKWIDLVIAREKPSGSSAEQFKRVMI